MTVELIVSPRNEGVQADLSEAQSWNAYAVELRSVLRTVIAESGVDTLQVSELLVSRPLPDRYCMLRNGWELSPAKAVDLVEDMVAGFGPYCRLSRASRLRIESGWNGAVHLYMPPEIANNLVGLCSEHVSLQWRSAVPESAPESRLVKRAADDTFWAAVMSVTGRVTLLCERWAYGAFGCRWFRITPENIAEVSQAVRPRSLLCVVVDPDLRLQPALLNDDFTAFKDPFTVGELIYRAYPDGADDLAEVIGDGFLFMLNDAILSNWCAVVPDPDGEVRGQWEELR